MDRGRVTRPDGVDPTWPDARCRLAPIDSEDRASCRRNVIERGGSVRLATALRELWISGAGVNKPDLVALVRAGGGS